MADHVDETTQTRYPWRATVRTIIAFVGGLALAAPLLYTAVTNQSPEAATGAGATALLVAGAITRLMANPFVNEWLTRLGLGAEPKQTN
ncbi:hypothetical protein [Paenarthrobacter ureafaciens]|uniref:hypothetical protein n=1 Tax=Paenarthrobacter ureafaciens TaxID=37931 RepID=UPI0022656790|nr:hypothetical protein [Paenarthrobacter ureafaciens]MCX8454601.1 hypothetical protein [Paenarthrobacter ureafaciens]MCY0974094.1 hypothetical protein [Paenarthrobacter ureafaciens]